MNAVVKNSVRDTFVYLLLSLATFLMLKMIVEYYPLNDHSGFLQYKQDYLHNITWKVCFYIHVFSTLFILMAAFTQFSSHILQTHRNWHRLVGRFYAINILFINFPCAMVMAIYANGGLPAKTAFIVLDCLWFLFTLKAVIAVRKKDFISHRNYMIRSYALTFSAITLRTWKIILLHTTNLDPLSIYMMQAWLGFVPNLLLAEWLIRRNKISRLTFEPNIIKNDHKQNSGY